MVWMFVFVIAIIPLGAVAGVIGFGSGEIQIEILKGRLQTFVSAGTMKHEIMLVLLAKHYPNGQADVNLTRF